MPLLFAAALSRMCAGGLVDKKEKRAVFRGVVAAPFFILSAMWASVLA